MTKMPCFTAMTHLIGALHAFFVVHPTMDRELLDLTLLARQQMILAEREMEHLAPLPESVKQEGDATLLPALRQLVEAVKNIDDDAVQSAVREAKLLLARSRELMSIEEIEAKVSQAPGHELFGTLPDGRPCVLEHRFSESGKDDWHCWIYPQQLSIDFSLCWSRDTLRELVELGQNFYEVDLLAATWGKRGLYL